MLLSSLAHPTDDQREIIRLRFLESRPVAEIAARLGKTEAAVHMLSHRGLKSLEELMGSITLYLSGLQASSFWEGGFCPPLTRSASVGPFLSFL